MKRLLVFTVFIICCSQMKAQSVAQDSTVKKTTVLTERVYGFWEVMGYVGGKLTGELSTRLNIDSKEKDTVLTEVKVELGWIKFTRMEDRPVKE